MAKTRGVGAGLAWKGASYVLEALKAWQTSRGSADRDLLYDRQTLLERSRALMQNSPFAGAAVNAMEANVVGTGLRARPALNCEILGISKDEASKWERKTRFLFEMWAGSKFCDAEGKNTFYQLQDLALKTQLISGDCFGLTTYQTSPASPFFTSIKLLEGDRCQNPPGLMESDKIAGGIEVDSLGRPIAYHFTKRPIFSVDHYTDIVDTVRVPAYGNRTGRPQVIHVFISDRPDQRRGIPWLAPVILTLKQEERYQDAELMAAVVSGMFTVFVTTADSASDPFLGNVPDGQRTEKKTADAASELTNGGIVELSQGEDVKFADPGRPNTAYEPFVNAIFTEAAARLGIGKGIILKKFDSSYSAARAEFMESYKTFKRSRANLASDFCQPIYEAWLAEAVMTHKIDAPDFFQDPMKRALYSRCRWVGEAPGMLDPLRETQAIKMQVDEQYKDRSTATVEVTGGDYFDIVENLAEEQKKRDASGLPAPGLVNKTESFSVATNDTSESAL